LTLLGCSNNHRRLGEEAVRKEYEKSLADSTSHNMVDNKLDIVKDEATAIKIAEAILVNIYGQECLDRERPYEIYRFDRHWVLRGTMAEELGGTFLIIIDAKTAEVLRITHEL
jgi:NTF2 fold immunity protein